MIRINLLFTFLLLYTLGFSQTNIINSGTDSIIFQNAGIKTAVLSPDGSFRMGALGAFSSSALIQLNSTTKGFLAPRMTSAQRDAITSPATGLLIYNSTTNEYNFYNGSAWSNLYPSSSSYWGSDGTNVYLNDANDNVAIGLSTAGAKLDVHPISSFNGIIAQFQNDNSANGSPTINAITNGNAAAINVSQTGNGNGIYLVNSSSTSSSSGVYLRSTGNSSKTIEVVHQGTQAGSTDYAIHSTATNGGSNNIAGYFSASGATNNYAGIFDQGNVGINTTSPTQKLEVKNGNILISNSSTAGELRFAEPGSTNYTAFKAGAQASDITYTLPITSSTGSLTNDGSGNLSWSNSSNNWSLTGNSGTLHTNYIGTNDNVSFRIKTNNQLRMIIDSVGRVGITDGAALQDAQLSIAKSYDGKGISSEVIGSGASSIGIYAKAINSSVNVALFGESTSPINTDTAYAVLGKTNISGNGIGAAVTGYSTSSPGTTGNAVGVQGVSKGNNTAVKVGVYGIVENNSNNPSQNYGGYFNSFAQNGHKNYGVYGIATKQGSEPEGSFFGGVFGAQALNNNDTAYGLYSSAFGGTLNYSAFFGNGYVYVQDTLGLGKNTIKIPNTISNGYVLTADGMGYATFQNPSGGSGWNLTGNAGTNYTTNFIGTTDNRSLRFRTNNTEQLILDSLGNVGVGTSTPGSVFHIATNNIQTGILFQSSAPSSAAGGFYALKTRGNKTFPAAVVYDDYLGSFGAMGYNGSDYGSNGPTGEIAIVASESFNLGQHGTKMILRTTDIGSDLASDRVFINSDGNVTIGTNQSDSYESSRLFIAKGNVTYNGTTSQLMVADSAYPERVMKIGYDPNLISSAGTGFIQTMERPGIYTNLILNPNGGKIGLGTTNPSRRLHIYDTDNNGFVLEGASGSGTIFDLITMGDGTKQVNDGASKGWQWLAYNDSYITPAHQNNMLLRFYNGTAATDVMYFANSSNVGLGSATAPEANLHIQNNAGTQLKLGHANQPALEYYFDVDASANFNLLNENNGTAISRMYISNSGNTGLGTANPLAELHIETSDLNTELLLNNNSTGFRSELTLQNNTAANKWGIISEASNFRIQDWNGGGGVYVGYSQTTGQNKVVLDYTGTGSVGVGTSPSGTYKLEVNGTFHSTGITESSDIRWKKDIKTIDNALNKTLQLRGVIYNWKKEEFKDKNFSDKNQIGLIAQEVESIIPQAVNTDANGYKSVEYSKLVALLIEAIKEQQTKIDQLERDNAQLKSSNANELNNLKAELNSLVKRLDNIDGGIKTSEK